MWIFSTLGRGGSTPNPHFFKSVDFQGGVGGLGSNFHTFLSNFIFFQEFCPILSSFCGLEGHFQGKIGEKFPPPQMCFHTLGGGGGSGWCGKNPHFFYEGFPYWITRTRQKSPGLGLILNPNKKSCQMGRFF